MSGSLRLQQQIQFIKEIDKLKTILRQTQIMNGSRQENSAEHSWHFALSLLLLAEYSSQEIDLLKSLKMAIIHDLVEIYAGDTFVYDEKAQQQKLELEKAAANKLFALLPEDQSLPLHELWLEYEEQLSPESQFAQAVDRLLPILCNLENKGFSWRKHQVTLEQVLAKNEKWKNAAPVLHAYLSQLLFQAQDRGFFKY